MVCSNHPSQNAVAQCAKCGAYVCSECKEKTAPLREQCGILCPDCYRKEVEGIRDFYAADLKKKVT